MYRETIINDGMVSKWVGVFKNDHSNVYDKEQSGRPSVITQDLVEKVDKKMNENRGWWFCYYLIRQMSWSIVVKSRDFDNVNQKLGIQFDKWVNIGGDYLRKYIRVYFI